MMTCRKNKPPTFLELAHLCVALLSILVYASGAAAVAQGPPIEKSEKNLERLVQGAPRAKTIAQIPPAFVRAIKREYESSPELRAETTFEAYLASRYFWIMESVAPTPPEILAGSKAVSQKCADGTCDAPLNPNVWTGAWTGLSQSDISDANLPTATWTPGILPNDNSIPDTTCGLPGSEAHHSIVPMGTDPEIPSLSTVAPRPSVNPASLRLGNRCIHYGGERISKTFTVLPEPTGIRPTLQFWYATVLQNPIGHAPSDQPGFGAFLYNGSTLLSGRIDIDPTTPGKQSFIVADQNNPFFGVKADGPEVVVYRDWTCVTIDLSGLEGQTVTLVLVNRDCGQGGHWGYSYVDSFCLGCEGGSTGGASFNLAQSSCSQGKLCFNYTVPRLPSGTTGTTNLTLDISQNGAVVKTLTSGPLTTSGTHCFDVALSGINPAIPYDWQATANFSVPVTATIDPVVIDSADNPCPTPTNPCCPPSSRDQLADLLFYQGSGSISAPYTLKFQPTAAFKSKMQAYIDYLHTLNPAMQAITIDWKLYDQGTGTSPATPPGPQVGVTARTTWSSPGTGNPVITGDPTFFSQPTAYPMVVGTWYRVQTAVHLENGQAFFPDLCTNNEIWVRIQVEKDARGSVLEIWGRDRLITRIPLQGS
jgi:hypothetical protein